MSDDDSFERLVDAARRVVTLAEDPHPGLATWCEAFWKSEQALKKVLDARASLASEAVRQAQSGAKEP
jgi:hypothetical protein